MSEDQFFKEQTVNTEADSVNDIENKEKGPESFEGQKETAFDNMEDPEIQVEDPVKRQVDIDNARDDVLDAYPDKEGKKDTEGNSEKSDEDEKEKKNDFSEQIQKKREEIIESISPELMRLRKAAEKMLKLLDKAGISESAIHGSFRESLDTSTNDLVTNTTGKDVLARLFTNLVNVESFMKDMLRALKENQDTFAGEDKETFNEQLDEFEETFESLRISFAEQEDPGFVGFPDMNKNTISTIQEVREATDTSQIEQPLTPYGGEV